MVMRFLECEPGEEYHLKCHKCVCSNLGEIGCEQTCQMHPEEIKPREKVRSLNVRFKKQQEFTDEDDEESKETISIQFSPYK